jgi:hypothetical protein
MASPALITLAALSPGLTFREALSGVLGSISLATWIFLLVRHVMLSLPAETTVGYNKQLTDGSQVPQLILNYKTGSADGISLAFLTVWLLGDATNLAGASYFPHQSLVACLSVCARSGCAALLIQTAKCRDPLPCHHASLPPPFHGRSRAPVTRQTDMRCFQGPSGPISSPLSSPWPSTSALPTLC